MQLDNRLRVYLSSSFEDLKAVRAKIVSYINQQKSVFSLVNMEDYTPETTPPVEKCVADVESCDIYIGLFAFRYGQVNPEKGKSITELELLAAEHKSLEILAFVLDGKISWPPDDVDHDRTRIEQLKKYALNTHLAKPILSLEDLYPSILTALNNAKERRTNKSKPSSSPEKIEQEARALRHAYLQWLLDCHERLEFRGIRHGNGGTVSVRLQQVYLALQADCANPLERAAARQGLFSEIAAALESSEIPAEYRDSAHWYIASGSPLMPSLEERDRLNALDPSQKELLNLADAYFRESQLVILGDPGSGKTTLARWLTLVTAQAGLAEQHELTVPLFQVDPTAEDRNKIVSLGKTRLPILIRIADYADERIRADELNQPPPSLVEFFGRQRWLGKKPIWGADSAACGNGIDPKQLHQMFGHALDAGEALVILDGLDEVPASALRQEILEEVDTFAQHWIVRRMTATPVMLGVNRPGISISSVTADAPGNRLIITSRIAGYHLSPLQGNLAHVTVEPMSLQAISCFIRNWMTAVHQETALPTTRAAQVEQAATREADLFLAKLAEPRQRGGRELATNPLLCGILATIFRQLKGDLPQERVQLYEQAVELLFEVWLRRRHDDDEDLHVLKYELYDILEPLAEHVHRHEPTGLIPEPQLRTLTLQFLAHSRGENPLRASAKLRRDVDAILHVVKEDIGLLAARGEGIYGFLHLTFQEYLAARALVSDQTKAVDRLAEHLGDSRWREAIRLALGHVNLTDPTRFGLLVQAFVMQETSLEDLLPQAALTVIGALPDLRSLSDDTITILVEQLLRAYANLPLRQRLPKRRALLAQAMEQLWKSSDRALIEACFCQVLDNAAKLPEQACALAELIVALDCCTTRLFQALLRNIGADTAERGWAIHKALRHAQTPRPGENSARIDTMQANLPFRQALLNDSTLTAIVVKDFDWLQCVFALYGGLGDFNCAEVINEYHRMAGFLQQEDNYREQYRHAYLARWGQDDGDFVYNMAVYLDTAGGAKLKQANAARANFDPAMIHRDSAWSGEIVACLRQVATPAALLPQLRQAARAGTKLPKIRQAHTLLALLDNAPDKPVIDETEAARIHADIADAMPRCAAMLEAAMSPLLLTLEPADWWALNEATQTLCMAHGSMPVTLATLRKTVSTSLNPYLVAEMILLNGQGFGDDAVYNSAVFADDSGLAMLDFLAAHAVMPLALQRKNPLRHALWPISILPPIELIQNDISPQLLTTIELIPNQWGFMRFWIMGQVFHPLIQANSHLLPEILACALGDSGERSGRNDILATFAPELTNQPKAAEIILQRIQELKKPYYRVRALLRLASHWPERRSALLAMAEQGANEVKKPEQRQCVYEYLCTMAENIDNDALFDLSCHAAAGITHPNNRARAFGRLGIASSGMRAVNCFTLAYQAASQITDEFERATTIRLLRQASAGWPETDTAWEAAINTIQNPVQHFRAREDWRMVIRLLTPALRDQTEYLSLWALIGLASEVAPYASFQVSQAQQWRAILAAESEQNIGQETANTTIIELTPVVTQVLTQLENQGQITLVESIFPRLKSASWEIMPFLHRQRRSTSTKIASGACLLLVEMQGISEYSVDGLLACLTAADDISASRAAMQLYGMKKGTPPFRASVIGHKALNRLFAAQANTPSCASNRISSTVTWFCERLQYDAPMAIAAWAEDLRLNEHDVAAQRGLASAHFLDDAVWHQMMTEFAKGPAVAQEALLASFTCLANHGRIDADQWAMLKSTAQASMQNETGQAGGIQVGLDKIVAVILTHLEQNQYAVEQEQIVEQLRTRLAAICGFSWVEIFTDQVPENGLARLESIGNMLYTTLSGAAGRWAYGANLAKSALQEPCFLEHLVAWAIVALTESIPDPSRFKPEQSYLIELLAGAASVAPARFLGLPSTAALRPLLMQTAIEQNTFVARCDAIRLLGYLRHLSVDLVPILHSALRDVEFVRDGAIEAMGLFRRMDPEVLPEMQKWLYDESGMVAFAAARLLTAIGRHTQIAGSKDRTALALRRNIIQILADAVRDPHANRPLDFGANTAPTPEIPMLCDFFFDCLLKVAGYDDGKG